MTKKNTNPETTNNIIKKLPLTLASHAFSLILLFILCDIMIGGFLFYQYVFLVTSYQPEALPSTVTFKSVLYQDVLNQWQAQQQTLQTDAKDASVNPFVSAPESAPPSNASHNF